MSRKIHWYILFLAVVMSGCGGSGGSKTLNVTWDANRDQQVNTTGGGYIIYYSQQTGFDVSSAQKVDIPYVSGDAAPTSTSIKVSQSGVWYLKIAAYGLVDGAVKTSSPSSQVLINTGG